MTKLSAATITVTIIAVIVAVTSLTTAAEPHWFFRKITRPTPPRVRQSDWPRNGSDSFVLARLENENVAPSPEADRVTLIRRVTLDLIGLPPTPEEVASKILFRLSPDESLDVDAREWIAEIQSREKRRHVER